MVLQDLCTPLHYATIYDHDEVLSVLLAANGDVNRMSKVSCMVLSLCDWPTKIDHLSSKKSPICFDCSIITY